VLHFLTHKQLVRSEEIKILQINSDEPAELEKRHLRQETLHIKKQGPMVTSFQQPRSSNAEGGKIRGSNPETKSLKDQLKLKT
jgi:hypothetical protein